MGTIKHLGGFCLAKGRGVVLIKIYFKFMEMGSYTSTELFPLGFVVAFPNTEEIPHTPHPPPPAAAPCFTSSIHFSKDLNSICTLLYEDITWTYRHTHVRVGIIHPFIRERNGLSTGTSFPLRQCLHIVLSTKPLFQVPTTIWGNLPLSICCSNLGLSSGV